MAAGTNGDKTKAPIEISKANEIEQLHLYIAAVVSFSGGNKSDIPTTSAFNAAVVPSYEEAVFLEDELKKGMTIVVLPDGTIFEGDDIQTRIDGLYYSIAQSYGSTDATTNPNSTTGLYLTEERQQDIKSALQKILLLGGGPPPPNITKGPATTKNMKISQNKTTFANMLNVETYRPSSYLMSASTPYRDPLAFILNRVWFKSPWYPNQIMFAPTSVDVLSYYNNTAALANWVVSYIGNTSLKHTMKGFVDYMCKPNQDGRCPAFVKQTSGMAKADLANPAFTKKDWLALFINQQLQQHVGKNGPLDYITQEYSVAGASSYKANKIKMEIEAHPNSIVALILLLWTVYPPGKKAWGSYIDMLKGAYSKVFSPKAPDVLNQRKKMLKGLMDKLYEVRIEKRIYQTQRSYFYRPKVHPKLAMSSVHFETIENYDDKLGRTLQPGSEKGAKQESSLAFVYEDVVDKKPPTEEDGKPLVSDVPLSYMSELTSWPQASHIILDVDTLKKSAAALDEDYYEIPFVKRLDLVLKDLVPPESRIANVTEKVPAGTYLYWLMGYLQFLYDESLADGKDRLNVQGLNFPSDKYFFMNSTNLTPLAKSPNWKSPATWLQSSEEGSDFYKSKGIGTPYNKMSFYPAILIDKEYEKSTSASSAVPLLSLLSGGDALLDTTGLGVSETGLPASMQSRHNILTIGNRVAKYGTITAAPIQSFIIDRQDATSPSMAVSIYDSQLFYDTDYEYAVTSLVLMPNVLSSYVLTPEDPIAFTSTGVEYTFHYKQRVGWEIKEIATQRPNETKTKSNFKYPPIPAWVEFYPFRGINNKILFNFKRISVGGDKALIQKEIKKKNWEPGWESCREFYEQNEKKLDTSNSVPFQDQPWEKIRIYQLSGDVPPTSVNDFKTLRREVDVPTEGSHAVLEIEPNVQHYFLFKSINNMDLVSYPSQVFSVKIYDEGGTVFPVVDVLPDFGGISTTPFAVVEGTKAKRKDSKEFTQNIRLEPAILQSAPNITKALPDLGYLNPSVFSNKDETKPQFKMRVTSNKTGRKVDFNILYRKNREDKTLRVLAATPEDVLVSWDSNVETAEFSKVQQYIDAWKSGQLTPYPAELTAAQIQALAAKTSKGAQTLAEEAVAHLHDQWGEVWELSVDIAKKESNSN